MRTTAILCCIVLLAACSSTGSGSGTGTTEAAAGGAAAGDSAKSAAGESGGELPTIGEGKSSLYRRIDALAATWQGAVASPGENARTDARAAETAIAREVWKEMDTVLSDLEFSENPRWRISAAKGLGFVNDPRARPALEGVLTSPEPRLLAAALVSLARIGSEDTEDVLVANLLKFPDPVVMGNAALCLARIFQTRRSLGMSPVSSDRIDGMEADLSVLLFEKGDAIVRANACQALGGLGTPGAEDALLNRLRDDDALVRMKVGQGLALTGTRRSQAPLLEALAREREENVKVMLALALGAVTERQGRKPPHGDLGTDAVRWKAWLDR